VTIRLPRATGAVAGQVTLAFGSFVLQLVAARALGPDGFGVFAMLFGALVMATALSSGLVGDSLTVLDRHDPVLRSALARVAAAVVACAAGVGVILGSLVVGLSSPECVALAAATAAFLTADLGRRLLMAALRFWHLVIVDGAGFLAAMTVLATAASSGTVSLGDVLLALAVGQGTACLVALACLPAGERARPELRWGGMREVFGFGGWRAAQQFVRPTALNATRVVVLVAVGAAAVGQLEAARLVVAPAMLLVQGLGSYLFATYAADRTLPLVESLRRADHGAAAMLTGAVVVTLTAATLLPAAAPLLGPGYDLPLLAVVGWGVYAASCAAVLPYGSLAAVRGRPAAVLVVRVVDSVLALAAVAVALLVLGAPAGVTPWLLAAGSFVGGALCRQLLLVPRLPRPGTVGGTPVTVGSPT
jgi:O-antigen/teichoic acid export membrane protein